MTPIDDALVILRQDLEDPKSQSVFYDLILNTTFFVPTLPESEAGGDSGQGVLPLIIDADGNDYLLLFDRRERLVAWAEGEVKAVELPGHLLAATSEPPLHWALNVGTDYSKQFLPEEIAWLKEVVARCEAAAAKEAEGSAS